MAHLFDATGTAHTALVVMARYPEAGKTKTRLARSIGNEAAAQLYEAFLTDIARRFTGQDYALLWAYTPTDAHYDAFVATLAPAFASSMTCFPQRGADLGERLLSAFQWTHAHTFHKTVLIGSDSPHITRDIVETALRALDDADVVLGPADDGGYYLIAMRQPYDVFSDIPMSTNQVTDMTIERAQRQGLTVQLIEQLFDIDELPDLRRLARLLATNMQLAPATATHLSSLKELS